MPEGHTLHRLALDLTGTFGDKVVRSGSPQGRFEAAARLDGRTLLEATAHGKHLFVAFSDLEEQVHVHLGLYGAFTFVEDPEPPVVGQVRWRLSSGRATADLRGPTACELLVPDEIEAIHARLGADPLDPAADVERAAAVVAASRAPIATLLMDQRVIAGVGNVYRAEVLFRHRIDPRVAGRDLRPGTFLTLWADLVDLMGEGVRTGRIDTVRPEHEPEAMGREPRVDDHGGEVYVYRRAGQPCLVCGTRVRTEVVAGRNLFWCPRCQRRR
ncbi:Fpg/Nei family DNA glycosylase [Aeromicrobium senzhongii]|uniref:DNA-(apurinic or apyrimidinic site) lyase n=1 Tax=Aeromicrobium senzhongii TaxID=2663859 RepID=A0ABX6SVA7_9ACTN|nr:DNA-formamidopyrimidine glycosylase family protein [Aeromicrobium senzhongii]MTB87946.1 Fpg/Nei family DNA glycosylase [Aeromicrobium senzhongii]QNL95038.1 Fpg/Nei family DNA glycosylase [Aeromicrobium senzhongii]